MPRAQAFCGGVLEHVFDSTSHMHIHTERNVQKAWDREPDGNGGAGVAFGTMMGRMKSFPSLEHLGFDFPMDEGMPKMMEASSHRTWNPTRLHGTPLTCVCGDTWHRRAFPS